MMNLIFCTSPLQALIAERIIDIYPNEEFYCIFESYPTLSKVNYYYKRLKDKCQGGIFIPRKHYSNPIQDYLYVLRILTIAYRLPRMQRVFMASLDSFIFRLLWSGVREAEFYTFDDGSINLSPKAFDTMNRIEDGKFLGVIKKLLRIPSITEFRALSLKHYTIYPHQNAMQRCEYIPLFANNRIKNLHSAGGGGQK